MRLIRSTHGTASLDTAVSTALLSRVARREIEPTLRLFVPGRIVAFGSQDRTRPGYGEAVAAVRMLGFDAVQRLAGGRAAVFHEGTIAFAWATPHQDSKVGVESRFEELAAIIVDAIGLLGLEGAVGETPGEYCPGRFSVHVGGRKVMGVGQRLVAGAAHIGGVVVVQSPSLVNAPLESAYRQLGYDWDPTVTGSLSDLRAIAVSDAAAALETAWERAGYTLEGASLETATLDEARRHAADHTAPIA